LFLRGRQALPEAREIRPYRLNKKPGRSDPSIGIEHEGMKTMFAVIKTGGRQYRVVPEDVLEIGKIAGDVGTIVQLDNVLVLGGDTPVLGTPTVAGATVAAEVLDHKRGPKVIAFKKRRRKNSKRKRGYRDEITVLRITEILADGKKPTVGPRPKREKAAAKPAEAAAE
jgi:large subunit ribosomal protein L21